MQKKVFKFGESSLAFIIPKKWADKEGLTPDKEMLVYEGNGGELILSVKAQKSKETEYRINDHSNAILLGRWIGLHYMYGTSKLKLYSSSGFGQEQLDSIEQKLNNDCIGFELTSQSNQEIIIEDFTNIKDINLQKILSRIKFLIDQEFSEILGGNLKTVIKIEKHVNRFYMLGVRYVNIIQPKDYLGYLGILNELEQISDSMVEIAAIIGNRNKEVVKMLYSQFALSFDAFNGNEESIEKIAQLRTQIEKKVSQAKMDKLEAYVLLNITNNLAGISEYGFRIEKRDAWEVI